jgi:hypothetical protein
VVRGSWGQLFKPRAHRDNDAKRPRLCHCHSLRFAKLPVLKNCHPHYFYVN